MNRSLLRRTLGLVLGLALLAVSAAKGPARAQELKDIKGAPVKFETKDGVTLQGTFYAGKDSDQPTVLMLHKLKSDSAQGSWTEFAKRLNQAGYSVLTFDFRGHGESKAVDPDRFWNNLESPQNVKWLKPKDGKGNLRDKIDAADFPPGYFPYLINDIAAAKLYLDQRNDAGKCNSQALIVLGAEDGAALGAMWMAVEWDRHTVAQVGLNALGRVVYRDPNTESEGKSQYCAIWLNIKTELAGKYPVRQTVRDCLERVGGSKNSTVATLKNYKVPMWFVTPAENKDDTDSDLVKNSLSMVKLLKGPDPEKSKLKHTALKRIVAKVDGADLLDKTLPTGDAILKEYLGKLGEEVPANKWSKTDIDTTPSIWMFGTIPFIAKTEKAKAMEHIPLTARFLLDR
jgi:pimeloyl-ACP methyl ester carboxylesterase